MKNIIDSLFTRFLTLSVCSILSFTFTGCGTEEEEASPVAVTKKSDTAKTAEVAPVVALVEEIFSYDPTNKRDPFKVQLEDENTLVPLVDGSNPQLKPSEETNTVSTPGDGTITDLQKLDLDGLRLVAVIYGTAAPLALVEDQSGRGYTLKIGTLIGKRLGRVRSISDDSITIQEEFRDTVTGKRIPQIRELKLQSKTGGGT